MDFEDQIPVGILHVLEADVPENAGIVNEDIDAAEVVNGSLDDLFAVLDAIVVCYRVPAVLLDLVDDLLSHLQQSHVR